jgi:hypothetical protein
MIWVTTNQKESGNVFAFRDGGVRYATEAGFAYMYQQ